MTSFSTDGQLCIDRKVVQTYPSEDLSDYLTLFDVEACCTWIATNNVSKVCLQFPDEWLSASVGVCAAMRDHLSPITPALYVLADSAHSRCCADVVSARRAGADALIVFGGGCGEAEEEVTSQGLRVKHVAVRRALRVEEALAALVEHLPSNVKCPKLYLDVSLKHHHAEVVASWQRRFPDAPVLILDKAPQDSAPDSTLDSSSNTVQDSTSNVCAYLGPRPRAMLRSALAMPECEWVSADWGSADGSRLLRRRRVQRERVRDAKALGAVVCATGAPGTLETLAALRTLAKAHGKRLYTLCVGEPTPPKLANFPEVEVYVIVACAESSWGELAERGERGELYRTSVLPETVIEALADSGDEPTLSLLSGRLRGVSGPMEAGEGTMVLSERAWRGLAVTPPGETPAPHIAAPGRAGTAQHYTHELAS